VAAVLARTTVLAPEYVEAVDPDALAPMDPVDGGTLLAVAARAGATRLIDNVILGEGLAGDPVVDG
jgi:pantoate--beta-alanine ligase